MKTTELLGKLIEKLEANEYHNCTTVISVILHAYELECTLEATFQEFEEWLELAANLAQYNDEWFKEQYWLWLFQGELEKYCEEMPLSKAIAALKSKYTV